MIKINTGDPQPLPCLVCNYKHGYQYTDMLKIGYTSFYFPDGKEDGGAYSESCRTLNYGVSAFCCNCGKRLPFKLNREE